MPFTGTSAALYDPPKTVQKYVAYCEGILSPQYGVVECIDNLEGLKHLSYPLFVKPEKFGGTIAIDEHSMCANEEELKAKFEEIID